ncbi:putative Kelch repeat-containing F-box family protein [Hibiscus syriacus]|uniref:Kelch repeat-containing F-box family protein n=1 Tax=Hibiscus syriacus TaxID=106335 RepID=A0A6A3BTR2_HIBSY|nr:putative Kelch repeat-containing F-box family protein [Hibiscus syriacus]
MLERCLLLHMNQQQSVKALAQYASIQPCVTITVWRELEKENKDFFEAYVHAVSPYSYSCYYLMNYVDICPFSGDVKLKLNEYWNSNVKLELLVLLLRDEQHQLPTNPSLKMKERKSRLFPVGFTRTTSSSSSLLEELSDDGLRLAEVAMPSGRPTTWLALHGTCTTQPRSPCTPSDLLGRHARPGPRRSPCTRATKERFMHGTLGAMESRQGREHGWACSFGEMGVHGHGGRWLVGRRACMATYQVAGRAWRPGRSPGVHGDYPWDRQINCSSGVLYSTGGRSPCTPGDLPGRHARQQRPGRSPCMPCDYQPTTLHAHARHLAKGARHPCSRPCRDSMVPGVVAMHARRPTRSPCTPSDLVGRHACPATYQPTTSMPMHAHLAKGARPSMLATLPGLHGPECPMHEPFLGRPECMATSLVVRRAWRPRRSLGVHGDLWLGCACPMQSKPRRHYIVSLARAERSGGGHSWSCLGNHFLSRSSPPSSPILLRLQGLERCRVLLHPPPQQPKPWLLVHTQSIYHPHATAAFAYYPRSDIWLRINRKHPPEHVSCSTLCSSNSTLLYFLNSSVFSYSVDPLHLSWHHVDPPSVYRVDPIAAVVGELIVIAGGVWGFEDDPLVVEIYDIKTRTWERTESLPAMLKDSAASTWLSVVLTWFGTYDLRPDRNIYFSAIAFHGNSLICWRCSVIPGNTRCKSLETKRQVLRVQQRNRVMPEELTEKLKGEGTSFSSIRVSSMAGFFYIYNPGEPGELVGWKLETKAVPVGKFEESGVTVAAMVDAQGNWRWDCFESFLPVRVLLSIAAKKGPLAHFASDMVGWNLREDRKFTIKSAYESLDEDRNMEAGELWMVIHKYRGLQKIKLFLWLVYWGRVMTNAERMRRHLTTDSSCPVCFAPVEDINHPLRQCPSALTVWEAVIKTDRLQEFIGMDLQSWLKTNLGDATSFAGQHENWGILFEALIWNIWLS